MTTDQVSNRSKNQIRILATQEDIDAYNREQEALAELWARVEKARWRPWHRFLTTTLVDVEPDFDKWYSMDMRD